VKITAIELMGLIATLPPEMPIEFSPISMAWLGTSGSMRADNIAFYTESGASALPTDPGARAVIQIVEERA
jgi:hypothetical protein